MKNWSNTIVGLGIIVLGTVLVNNVGLTQECTNEITSRLSGWLETLKWAPLAAGGALVFGDRVRKGDITLFGKRKV